jgi:outer membrane protein
MNFLTRKFKRKERRTSGALCVLLALLVATPAAAIPLTQDQVGVYESADEGQRVHFLIERAKMGEADLVETLLQRYPLQGPHAANRTLYIRGLIFEVRGNLTGATENYRAALASDPSLTLVRIQLTQTLEKLGQDDSAKHHLELLQAEAPSEEVAGSIRAFIDRINAKRPLTFNGFVSIAPSTNINSGSSHSQVYSPKFGNGGAYLTIDPSAKKSSGIGIAAGGSVGYSKRLGNNWEAVLAADLTGQFYKDSTANSYGLSQSAEMRYHLDNGYVGLGAVADQSTNLNISNPLTDGLAYHSYGPRVSLLRFVGDHSSLHASAVYEWRKYGNATLLDGTALLTEASFNHGFDQTFNVTLHGGYDKINSNLKHISYATWIAGLGFYKELPFGINLNADAQVNLSTFDDVHPFFGVTRKDQRYVGSLAVTKRDLNIMGFAPSLSYSYTKNASNIAAYDFDAHAVDFRLTKDF